MPRLIHHAKQTTRSLREHGVSATARLIGTGVRDRAARLLDRSFDRRYGVATSGCEWLYRADGPADSNPHYFDYQPTPVRTVRGLLGQLGPDLDSSTFIDFGSGRGRVLLLASELGFRKVIGVEFDRNLHESARANIRAFRGQKRCKDVISVHGRAEEFTMPPGDLVLYFFHAFGPSILERVLARAIYSYRQSPRRIRLVFFRHSHVRTLDGFSEFHRLPVAPLPFDLVRMSSDFRDSTGSPYDAAIFQLGRLVRDDVALIA